jgi:hypothetical protein
METRNGVTEMAGADDALSAGVPTKKRKSKERMMKVLRAAEPMLSMILAAIDSITIEL